MKCFLYIYSSFFIFYSNICFAILPSSSKIRDMISNGFALTLIIMLIILFVGVVLTYIIQMSVSSISSTPKEIVPEIIDKFGITANTVFADLGAGMGNVIFPVAERKNIKCVAIELSPILGYLMLIRKLDYRFFKKKKLKVEIIVDNFISQDMKGIDIMYCNIPKRILNTFEKRIDKLLDQGKTIFTYQNQFNNHKPEKVYTLSDETKMYRYKK